MKLNIVPARSGIQWVKLGVRTFFKQPLALAGLFFLYFMVVSLLASVPVVGAAIAFMLAPAATLGIMAAAEAAAEGKFPMPSILLAAFRRGPQRTRAMLALGAIYAVVLLAILVVASLLGGPAPAAPEASATPQPPELTPSLALFALLQLPLLVVFAHAPALVHWHGLSPGKSLFFSLVAFWRNLGAFVVFGLAWMAVLALVILALGLMIKAFGSAASIATFMPAALIVASMVTCSLYFTFRDCYQADETDNPPGGENP